METKLKVNLISYTPEPEKVVAAAAKLCYSKTGVTDIMDGLSEDKINKFITMLVDMGHESPVEHVSFTFAVEGVSRVLTHQLVRHRIASYSQQSQRYVRLEQFEYVIPSSISDIPEAKDIFVKTMQQDQKSYNILVETLIEKHTKKLINEGMTNENAIKKAEKMAIEDARYVFPNACETKIVVTMNVRSLYNFFKHRCCSRAQWEIRALADEMLKEVKKVAPNLFKNAGPSCLSMACPEGKMTCGNINDVREKYLNRM